MYVEPSTGPSVQQSVKPSASSNVGAPGDSVFSVGAVLSLSFSTFFKHPFVFIGLSLLSQIPGIVVAILMRNAAALETIALFVSYVLGLVIQGASSYAVYEIFRGNDARFGKSLSRGMVRIIPMTLGILSLAVVFFMIILLVVLFMWTVELGGIGAFALALPLLIQTWLWCKWCVFIPACAAEHLGPVKSLKRSSELTKGCRLKIFSLCLFSFVSFAVFLLNFGLGFGLVSTIFMINLNPIVRVLLAQLAFVAPMAFGSVMTAVIYYELRKVKDKISIDSLANVFD